MENTNQNTETKKNLPWAKEESDADPQTKPLSLDEIREVIREIRY